MPYAIERLESRPVISIFRSAKNPMRFPAPVGSSRKRSSAIALAFSLAPSLAFDHTAGQPAVANAELWPGIGIEAAMDDDGMADNVEGTAVADGNAAQIGDEVGISLGAGDQVGQIADACSSGRRANQRPHLARARCIRR